MENLNREWLNLLKKMPSLFFGLFLYAVGIVFTLYSKMGMSPWEVFHMGIVKHTELTLGQVSQIVGFIILFISCFIGVIPGLGSVFNMIFIGIFIDFVNGLGIFATPQNLYLRLVMLFTGIIIIGWASYFYLRVQLGAGPRDGLMEGLAKKLPYTVGTIRGAIEIVVLAIGFFLGGPVGIGTLIYAFAIGFSVQFAFKIGKYDSKTVEHINLIELYKKLVKSEDGISGGL